MKRVLSTLVAGALAGSLPVSADVRMLLPLYERYVAIDGACAWPQLTLLPSGNIAALIWPESNHGLTEGAVECWTSTDGGISWRRVGVPVPNEPGTNRMNLSSGLTSDGALITIVSGWDRVRPKPAPGQPISAASPGPIRGKTRNPVPAVSRDAGRTWTRYEAVPPVPGTNDTALIPHGRIIPLPDGKLGGIFYGTAVYFFTSSDHGKTWQQRGQLTRTINVELDRTHNETNWLPLDNGEYIAVSRTYGDRILEAFRSRDGGASWVSEGALTAPSQHPGALMRLPDGRILLSYGMRNTGNRGISIRVADSAARLWSDPMKLVDFEDWQVPAGAKRATDGGYPSTIVLDDGMLVTAYYCAGVPEHRRYHMGIVRWRLDQDAIRWPINEGPFRRKGP